MGEEGGYWSVCGCTRLAVVIVELATCLFSSQQCGVAKHWPSSATNSLPQSLGFSYRGGVRSNRLQSLITALAHAGAVGVVRFRIPLSATSKSPRCSVATTSIVFARFSCARAAASAASARARSCRRQSRSVTSSSRCCRTTLAAATAGEGGALAVAATLRLLVALPDSKCRRGVVSFPPPATRGPDLLLMSLVTFGCGACCCFAVYSPLVRCPLAGELKLATALPLWVPPEAVAVRTAVLRRRCFASTVDAFRLPRGRRSPLASAGATTTDAVGVKAFAASICAWRSCEAASSCSVVRCRCDEISRRSL